MRYSAASGLGTIGLDTVVDSLSGGERRRVALAAALVTDADLLLLDEPTNHLDIEGIAWLAAHLVARRSALVAVTHDRWFLDAVAALTWEVVDGTVQIREGGYSDWVFARAERLRLDRAAEERRRNLARKELAWLRRGPPARTSKPRYRIEAAEALIADVPEPRNSVELATFARRRLGKDVLDLEDVSVSVPGLDLPPAGRGNLIRANQTDNAGEVPAAGGRKLLDRVTWRLGPGNRIGVVGVNGSGKSTVLRVLVGELPPESGSVKVGRTVRLGYLSQEVVELPGELRLLEAVSEVAGLVNLGGKDLTAGQLAERFGFPTAQQWTRVAELSGGERRRLQLLRILMAEPNVLVLDEPTNDLDTDTLAALEDLLDAWPGTLIVVSHDRYLIERVTDDVVALLGDGRITHLPGGIDEYLRRRAAARESGPAPAGSGAAGRVCPVPRWRRRPPAPTRPPYALCARTCNGWRRGWNRCSARSPPCTSAWPRQARTMPRRRIWTPNCEPCWTRRTRQRPTGSPSPNNSNPDPARTNRSDEAEVGNSCPTIPDRGIDPGIDQDVPGASREAGSGGTDEVQLAPAAWHQPRTVRPGQRTDPAPTGAAGDRRRPNDAPHSEGHRSDRRGRCRSARGPRPRRAPGGYRIDDNPAHHAGSAVRSCSTMARTRASPYRPWRATVTARRTRTDAGTIDAGPRPARGGTRGSSTTTHRTRSGRLTATVSAR